MAMGRRQNQRQQDLWMAAPQLARTLGHPFYQRVNALLDKFGFDDVVEAEYSQYYAEKMGRPSIPPVVYFKMLFTGFFEGIDAERGIAWRVADSTALRAFLDYGLTETTPDHSSVSRTRRMMSLETHSKVFHRVLGVEGVGWQDGEH